MDFEDFEGFKRIENKRNLTAEKIFDILDKYKEILGEMSYEKRLDNSNILIDFKGRYNAEIKIEEDINQIIIERKCDEDTIETDSDGKIVNTELDKAYADRLIEQIYDLINDYMENGTIREHITGEKKILFMNEEERLQVFGGISFGKIFIAKDENDKKMYEIKENALLKTYSLKNIETTREELVINYSQNKDAIYSIVTQPFENIVIKKDKESVKTRFIGTTSSKELKISADYSESHYLIELDEIVIGSIDCLDPLIKHEYKIGINDLSKSGLILAIAVIVDNYNSKFQNGVL